MFCGVVRPVFLSVARFLFRLTFSLVFNRATDVSYGRRGRQFPAFVRVAVPPHSSRSLIGCLTQEPKKFSYCHLPKRKAERLILLRLCYLSEYNISTGQTAAFFWY